MLASRIVFCRGPVLGHYRIAVVKDPFEGIIKGIFNEGLINGVGLTATAGEKLSSHFLEPKIFWDKWSFLNLFFVQNFATAVQGSQNYTENFVSFCETQCPRGPVVNFGKDELFSRF